MKIKRFSNIWTMGLILFGAILVLFYVAKIFFPEFIVGVAETPSIVAFGEYIDSHWWARDLFDFFTTLIVAGIYFCACCRVSSLKGKSILVLLAYCISLRVASHFYPQFYTHINYIGLILCPFLICVLNKSLNEKVFISTVVCFCADIFTQILSLCIRDITVIANNLNTATFFILLIDAFIWRILFYCFYNYKKEGEGNG